MKLRLGGVRVRLWLATALPAMLVIGLLVVGFASQYGGRMAEALKDRGAASARQLGSAAEFSLFAEIASRWRVWPRRPCAAMSSCVG